MLYEEKTRLLNQWGKIWKGQDVPLDNEINNDDEALPLFRKYLKKDGLILEGGAGLGSWVIALSKLGYKITGVEIVPECVARVREKHPKLDFRTGDILHLDFPDNTFDAYISWGVIEHFIKGPEEALAEAHRVLKPGGVFIVAVPAYNISRRMVYPLIGLLKSLKEIDIVRKIFGKRKILYSREEKRATEEYLRENLNYSFHPMVGIDPLHGKLFDEYRYRKNKLEETLRANRFKILAGKPISYEFGMREFLGYLGINMPFDSISKSSLLKSGRYFGKHFFNHLYMAVAQPIK